MRGEFIRGDGLVIPNNVSKEGARVILAAAFRNDVPTWYFGLVIGAPSPLMTFDDMEEPTIGTNGYARQAVTRDATGWPVQDELAGQRYIESATFVWTATGSGFDKPIQRVALLPSVSVDPATPVYALSAPLESALSITAATPINNRSFKYRLYL